MSAYVVVITLFALLSWGSAFSEDWLAAGRADGALIRAGELNDDTVMFVYDEGQMVIPLSMTMNNKEAFVDWTLQKLGHEARPQLVGGVQEMFFNLLSSCSGVPFEELTRGSRMIVGAETGEEHGE